MYKVICNTAVGYFTVGVEYTYVTASYVCMRSIYRLINPDPSGRFIVSTSNTPIKTSPIQI